MNSDELAVWRSLLDTTTDLRRLLSAQLAQDSQLSPGDYAVLLALSEAEGRRLRSSELAATMDWERSRLSHHLGRMEKRGLIGREECATDNRGAEVVMTDAGAAAFTGATVPHMRAIKRHFADALSPDQFDALRDVLQSINDHHRDTEADREAEHDTEADREAEHDTEADHEHARAAQADRAAARDES